MGTIEKARSFRERLETLAKQNPNQRGRLLALAAAGIIENRDLFPDVEFRQVALSMVLTYEREAESWTTTDRIFFLDSLARLDSAGDPRLHTEQWVDIKPPNGFALHRGVLPTELTFAVGWAPVTAQEFQQFIRSSRMLNSEYWEDAPSVAITHRDATLRTRIQEQLRHPNWPVANVSFYEAIAYCKWRTAERGDKRTIRLPLTSEWQKILNLAVRTLESLKRPVTSDNAPYNCSEFGLGHPSPVGAFPHRTCGACDVIGNVWQWLLPDDQKLNRAARTVMPENGECAFPVAGRSYEMSSVEQRERNFTLAPGDLAVHGYASIGFRCVLSSEATDVSKQISKWRQKWIEVPPIEARKAKGRK